MHMCVVHDVERKSMTGGKSMEQKRFTATYAGTNPNFVIQNLRTENPNSRMFSLCCVVQNLLMRGKRTTPSAFLQEKLEGTI